MEGIIIVLAGLVALFASFFVYTDLYKWHQIEELKKIREVKK